ncbi:MAG TPA: DUF1385 domain-containing protein [Thermomicrobiaceae bacterium]|nr:DUF1385 domain-containing protein [Thermomicrobiaceae bacterium]
MAEQSYYGGQAVMEGVMMRGRQDMAVAVRTPDGEIAVYHERLEPSGLVRRLRPMPLLRGVFLLWDTMLLGMRALIFSANVSLADDTEVDDGESPAGPLTGVALWGTVAISIALSIALFFVAPLAVVHWLDRYIQSSIVSNLVEGGIRLAVLLGYLGILGQLPDIRRLFGYHGAEHKTINAWEAGDELDVAHVRAHSISHPRCGTGFLLVVVLLSVIVFAFLGRPPFALRVVSRIVLVPVIAALAYEFIKWTAGHLGNPVVRVAIAPSLALQRLTTREPDDQMLEAAIASFKRVLVAEGTLEPGQFFCPGVVAVDEAGRQLQPSVTPVQV